MNRVLFLSSVEQNIDVVALGFAALSPVHQVILLAVHLS